MTAANKVIPTARLINGTSTPAPPNASSQPLLTHILILLLTFIIGILSGAYGTSTLLESEYQQIVSKLRSNQHAALSISHQDYKTCKEELRDAKNIVTQFTTADIANANDECSKELKAFQSQARHDSLLCMQEMEREMMWSHKAYEDTTVALSTAETKLKLLKEESITVKQELQRRGSELNQANSNLERTTTLYEEAKTKLDNIVSEVEEAKYAFEQIQIHVGTFEEEIERRDMERAQCDVIYREYDTCKRSLKGVLEGKTDGCQTSISLLEKEKEKLSSEVSTLEFRNKKIVEESESLRRRAVHLEQQLENENTLVRGVESERDGLLADVDGIWKKVGDRDRMTVLHRYGQGPHLIKITIRLPTNPSTEEILILELAPLNLMPHTIKSFIEMIERKTLANGTLLLALPHILSAGPEDYHDEVNNERLSSHGYSNGVLLFNEYTDEYRHDPGTVAFTATKKGPTFYINLVDNAKVHSEVKDPCFGRLVKGFDIIERIAMMPKMENGVFELPIYIVDAEMVENIDVT